jgi:hypothetical protein
MSDDNADHNLFPPAVDGFTAVATLRPAETTEPQTTVLPGITPAPGGIITTYRGAGKIIIHAW